MAMTTQKDFCHHQHDDNDAPVNKATSFNGRLDRYFHTSKNLAATKTATKPKSSTLEPLLEWKRDSESRNAEGDGRGEDELNGFSRSKRRKGGAATSTSTATDTTADNPMAMKIPARITRSRSASLLQSQSSAPSPLATKPTTPKTTTPRPRRRQTQQPQPQQQPTPPTRSLLRDTIPPNLHLLLVGVNPGLQTGLTGHAYAHPSNLFWKLLHSSRITPIRHPPSDTYRLPHLYNIGNTNIVERPTRDASMLSRAEMDAGVPMLEAKVAAQRPEVVCLVGKSIWEAVWRVRRGRGIRKEEFRYGWQDEGENMGRCAGDGWEGARVFVATTTSGLAAGMSMAEKQAVWNELGDWVVKRREEQRRAGQV